MHALWLLAAVLSIGCASPRKPEPYKPQYIYMVLYGGKFRGYPYANSGFKEIEVETSKVVGGMCLTPDEWAEREKYILDLESFAERK